MPVPSESQDALFAALAQAGNETAQGWMRLAAGAPALGPMAAWLAAHAAESSRVAQLQAAYLENQSSLWNALLVGRTAQPEGAPEAEDRRFAAREWREDPYFAYLRQSYALAARYVGELVDGVRFEGQARERIRFAARQWLDAACPANFAATNPEALREALRTGGESLVRGLANLIADARRGRISQCDETQFEVGRNLATTRGDVVFENELIQLIQYAATTPRVARRPLVMVPPCINKYYILDLQPENSFVRYAVAQGHTVFMVSWRNVGPELGHLTWDDYLEKGVLAALRVAREIAGSERVNALGFCVGGTLLGAALAVLAARRDASVASATWLTTMLEFSEPGLLGLFVDEASVAAREASIGHGGILPGADLDIVFSALRANDLVWPYVVNNYLKGGTPAAFDLLYWNADSTNLPGPMYCTYLRNTYLENRLRVPGAFRSCGVALDLGAVRCPSFVYSSREDHIVPWRAAYRTLGVLGGERSFVLGASGHIAGVINPPEQRRRSYWSASGTPASPEEWLARATEHRGSWWPRWSAWLGAHGGGERAAPRATGSRKHRPIEPAPGRYAKERAPAAAPARASAPAPAARSDRFTSAGAPGGARRAARKHKEK